MLNSIVKYIVGKLFLKVNQDKTRVAYVRKIKFLGTAFMFIKEKEGLEYTSNAYRN